jgi:hypothetical protein
VLVHDAVTVAAERDHVAGAFPSSTFVRAVMHLEPLVRVAEHAAQNGDDCDH